MKILIRQFLGKRHSWCCFGWGIADALIAQGHELDLFSTDGIEHLPEHLKNNLIGYAEENSNILVGQKPSLEYDCQISYTCMKNFPYLLSNGSKNRFGTWVFEWSGKNVLPTGFAKNYKFCDYLISPSNFGKQIFVDSGVQDDKIKVIPHGIDINQYQKNSTIKLPTNKKFKILANIAQTHLRKNLPGLLEAYGKAFNKNDDVCLLLKAKEKAPKFPFDVSLSNCIQSFKKQYPLHAEIKIFSDFIEDMSDLYRSVDCTFTMSHCEGFYMVGMESIAAGKVALAPNHGGQLDFLNSSNSLLIDGKEERANPLSMYWESKPNAIWFKPSINSAVEKLQFAYKNYETLNKEIKLQQPQIFEKYSWNNIAKEFISLCL